MTIDEIKARIKEIESNSDDDEVAHSMEDALHEDVLKAIAAGASNAAELAKETLKTYDIKFERWCA